MKVWKHKYRSKKIRHIFSNFRTLASCWNLDVLSENRGNCKGRQSLEIEPRTPGWLLGDTFQCLIYWCSTCSGLCGVSRSSVAEHWRLKPDILGSIPSDCQPFHFPLFCHKHPISLCDWYNNVCLQLLLLTQIRAVKIHFQDWLHDKQESSSTRAWGGWSEWFNTPLST